MGDDRQCGMNYRREVPVDPLVVEAGWKGTSPERIRELAQHEFSSIREVVAKRDDLPDDVAVMLANDPNVYVREQVAKRPVLPAAAIERLARDGDTKNRYLIASRRDLPVLVVCQMWHDPERAVVEELRRSQVSDP